MNTPAARPATYTITGGLDLLDEYTATATQSQKNLLSQIVFAVADKTVYAGYTVIDDAVSPMEFFVLTKSDLTVKIRLNDLDSFAILYAGPSRTAPGLDAAWPAALSLALDALL